MNHYEWMDANTSPNEPPLAEPESRENPENRPVPPEASEGSPNIVVESPAMVKEINVPDVDKDLETSNESIVEDVRKFFGVHNRGGDYRAIDGNSKASMANVVEMIEKTFGNSEWIAKQTPVKGEITVGDLMSRINVDYPVETIQETAAINKAYRDAIIPAHESIVKQLVPAVKLNTGGKPTDAGYEALSAVLEKLPTLIQLVKKPSRSSTDLLEKKQEGDKRPALTISEVGNIGNAIVTAMKADQAAVRNHSDNVKKQLELYYELQANIYDRKAESPKYNNAAWETLVHAITDKLLDFTPESMSAMRKFSNACIAAIIYMERSIKGGLKPATEDFQVSLEGLFDAIKSFFTKKPDIHEIKWIDEGVEKDFEKTLFNKQWVDSQKLVEGPVKFKFPKAAANGNYTPLVNKVESELITVAAQNSKLAKAYYAKVKPAFDAMNIKIADRDIEELRKLRNIADYEDLDFEIKWVAPKNVVGEEIEVELPALDKDGIQKAAKAILVLVKALSEYHDECLSNIPRYPKPAWRELVKHIDDQQKELVIREYFEDLESIADYGVESFFQRTGEQWDTVEALTYGLMRWIAKSISGIAFDK